MITEDGKQLIRDNKALETLNHHINNDYSL